MSLIDRLDNRITAIENEIEYLRSLMEYEEHRRYLDFIRPPRRPTYPRNPLHDLRFRNNLGTSSIFNQRIPNLYNLSNLGNLNNTNLYNRNNTNHTFTNETNTNRTYRNNTNNTNNTSNTNENNTNRTYANNTNTAGIDANRLSNFSRLFQNIIPDLVEVSFVDSEGRPINRINNNSISLQNLRNQTTIEIVDDSDTENDNETSEETNMCTICRNELLNGEVVRKINSCGHKFHIECIDRWFEEHNQCPTCRHDLNRTEV